MPAGRKRTKKPRPPITSQETIKEVQTKSFEVVRLSRTRYADNPHIFIDIRYFRRGYDDNGGEVYFPTTKGVQLTEELFLTLVNQTVLLGLKRKLAGPTGGARGA